MAIVHGRGPSGEAKPLCVDEWTWQLITIGYIHHEIHEGDTYQVSYFADDVADSSKIIILLRVGDVPAHMTYEADAGADATIELLENPTVNDAGTAMTEYNQNRTSANTATVTAFHTPTLVGGTQLVIQLAPGGRGPQAGGGSARADSEWILDSNEDYAIQITNISGQAQPMSVLVEWYEEKSH